MHAWIDLAWIDLAWIDLAWIDSVLCYITYLHSDWSWEIEKSNWVEMRCCVLGIGRRGGGGWDEIGTYWVELPRPPPASLPPSPTPPCCVLGIGRSGGGGGDEIGTYWVELHSQVRIDPRDPCCGQYCNRGSILFVNDRQPPPPSPNPGPPAPLRSPFPLLSHPLCDTAEPNDSHFSIVLHYLSLL